MQDFPFKVVNVLFNSILVLSTRALAKIAVILGHDGVAYTLGKHADHLEEALEHLWDPASEMYFDFDVAGSSQLPVVHLGGLGPLILGRDGLRTDRRERLKELVKSEAFSPPEEEGGLVVASVPTVGDDFAQVTGWRGAVNVATDWLIWEGFKPTSQFAQRITCSVAQAVVRNGGFHVYFDSETGKGMSYGNYSSTAALFHDLFCMVNPTE